MRISNWPVMGVALVLFGCVHFKKEVDTLDELHVTIVGSLKEVMWEGAIAPKILLDTLTRKQHLYAIGPESYLRGEILIWDGKSYVSRIAGNASLVFERTYKLSSPFLAYSYVEEWREHPLPEEIKTLKDLETFMAKLIGETESPVPLKLQGTISNAHIHVQNLPAGTVVSSPSEAHQGQVNLELGNSLVKIFGYYATNYQGILTHHDSYLHLHLLDEPNEMMGHLDGVQFRNIILYVPKK